eukprot:3764805-Pyramimonas_sp.AAC.1
MCTRGQHQRLVCRLLHQISFRYCVNLDCTPIGADEAARLIAQGITAADSDLQEDGEEEDDLHEGQPPAAPADETAVWAPMLDPCQQRNPQGPHLLR